MDIEGKIYIYYENDGSENNVLLKDYKEYLKNENCNKDKICKIFKKKFLKDFIESSTILIDEFNLYPAGLLLSSGIDVLAKNYTGNSKNKNIGENYKKFFEEYFEEYKLFRFYNQFRCGLVHSGTTPIDFTVDNEIKTMYEGNGKQVINLNCLRKSVKNSFKCYMKELKSNDEIYQNFIKVQKKIYE